MAGFRLRGDSATHGEGESNALPKPHCAFVGGQAQRHGRRAIGGLAVTSTLADATRHFGIGTKLSAAENDPLLRGIEEGGGASEALCAGPSVLRATLRA